MPPSLIHVMAEPPEGQATLKNLALIYAIIIYKLYQPPRRNTDIRDRRALVVPDARTYRLSTNEGVGFMVATPTDDGKKLLDACR